MTYFEAFAFFRSAWTARMTLGAGILFLGLLSGPAHAEIFRNAYLSFELPSNWNCRQEHTEWICISQASSTAKEATIILTAKVVGPADTFPIYKAHLQSPRQLPDAKGKPLSSKVVYVMEKTINNHKWLDGLHLGSEIASYYTRYLVTLQNQLAVLVTFSAHQKFYTKYSADFNKAIQSLRVLSDQALMAQNAGERPNLSKGGQIGVPGSSMIEWGADQMAPEPQGLSNQKLLLLAGLGLLLAAASLLLYVRAQRAKKKRLRLKKSRARGDAKSPPPQSKTPPRKAG